MIEIRLSFHQDSPDMYPQGYWYAASSNGYDGDGATLLNAMTDLAEQMARALNASSDD